jgi:adenosylcobinamide-GDP ribazoletransferase
MRAVRGLVTAARYLTIVPVPGRRDESPDSLGRAAPWFPAVGAAIGLGLVVVDHGVSAAFPPVLASLLTVTAWKLVTGGLHLDGLADSLDGFMGHDRAQRLAIMRDSRIGVFGALGLIVALLIAVTSLAEIAPRLRARALLVAPIVGRATPPLLAALFPAARTGGQGATFIESVRWPAALLAIVLALATAMIALGVAGAVACVVGTTLALATGALLSRRLGGITGDVLGAAVELSELGVLLTVTGWSRGIG